MFFVPPNGSYLNKKQYLCDQKVAKDKISQNMNTLLIPTAM